MYGLHSGQASVHIYFINLFSLIHLFCDFVWVPRLKLTFKETFSNYVDVNVERLKLVGQIWRNTYINNFILQ